MGCIESIEVKPCDIHGCMDPKFVHESWWEWVKMRSNIGGKPVKMEDGRAVSRSSGRGRIGKC